jgi:peptidyl-prolyl cis-trans isomerase C
VGDVSEPVLTSFGWHLMKLDGKRPAGEKRFEEVREQILLELKQKYVNERRDAAFAAVGRDPSTKANDQALEALYQRPPDVDTLRRAPAASPATR